MTDERSSQPPQAVKSYAQGIAARTAARQEERRQNPIFPNLGQAAVTHRPEDQQTLEEVGRTQRTDASRPEEERQQRTSLSPETVEGLKALHAAQEQQRKPEPAPVPVEEPKEPAVDDELDPEDQVFAEALQGARKDVIQNERERAAVAKRVPEIDLAEGLISGEFTQLVPVVPDKLNVRFRCLTPGENNELRLYLYEEVQKDPRKAQMAQDLLAFYQTVASVVSLNKHDYHRHMVPEGPSGRLVFNREVFEQKLHAFMAFPLPLIASLGTHSGWFEQRVRALFATTDRIKNG